MRYKVMLYDTNEVILRKIEWNKLHITIFKIRTICAFFCKVNGIGEPNYTVNFFKQCTPFLQNYIIMHSVKFKHFHVEQNGKLLIWNKSFLQFC